jgi:hypothetical protein
MHRCIYELPHYKSSRAYILLFTNYRHQAESYTVTILLKYILKKPEQNCLLFEVI